MRPEDRYNRTRDGTPVVWLKDLDELLRVLESEKVKLTVYTAEVKEKVK